MESGHQSKDAAHVNGEYLGGRGQFAPTPNDFELKLKVGLSGNSQPRRSGSGWASKSPPLQCHRVGGGEEEATLTVI